MAVFNIFEHPDKGADSVVLVREGFSAGAFVFTVFWALWHRMWMVAAIVLVLLAVMALASSFAGLPEGVAFVMNFGLSLLLGLEGNALRALSLRQAGYVEVANISAGDRSTAELSFELSRREAKKIEFQPMPRPIQPPTDTLGLFGNV